MRGSDGPQTGTGSSGTARKRGQNYTEIQKTLPSPCLRVVPVLLVPVCGPSGSRTGSLRTPWGRASGWFEHEQIGVWHGSSRPRLQYIDLVLPLFSIGIEVYALRAPLSANCIPHFLRTQTKTMHMCWIREGRMQVMEAFRARSEGQDEKRQDP